MTGRRGRRRGKLLDGLKERRGYCHLKEEALDHTMWRARFDGGFGPVVRQTTKLMNILVFGASVSEELLFWVSVFGEQRGLTKINMPYAFCDTPFMTYEYTNCYTFRRRGAIQ